MRETFQKSIPKEKHFHLEDGRSFGSVEELYKNIDSIDDKTFNRHLYNDDFSKWIRDVFLDKAAYNEITWAKSKKEFKEILKRLLYPDGNVDIISKIHVADPDKGKDIAIIVDEDKKKLSAEKIVYDKEKNDFKSKQLEFLLKKAEDEIALKNYQNAYYSYEQALSLYPDNESIKKMLENIKILLNKTIASKDASDDAKAKEEKDFAEKMESLKTNYENLKERIKNARKAGKDPYIAELNLMKFKAKVDIAKVTRSEKDIITIKNLLSDSEKELKEAEDEKPVDIYEEIEEGAKKLIEEDLKNEAKS